MPCWHWSQEHGPCGGLTGPGPRLRVKAILRSCGSGLPVPPLGVTPIHPVSLEADTFRSGRVVRAMPPESCGVDQEPGHLVTLGQLYSLLQCSDRDTPAWVEASLGSMAQPPYTAPPGNPSRLSPRPRDRTKNDACDRLCWCSLHRPQARLGLPRGV